MLVPGNQLFFKGTSVPPLGPGYPLDDDGTLAGMFGISWIPTDAPLYNQATYTYQSPASPTTAGAVPSVARFFSGGSAQIDLTGKLRACEFELTTQPNGAYDIYLMAVCMNGNTPTAQKTLSIEDSDGSTPTYNGASVSFPRSATSNIRIGIIVDQANDTIYFVNDEGDIWGDFSGLGGATHVVFAFLLEDTGSTAFGETATMKLIPDAANMSNLYPTNCYDYNDTLCPVNPGWVTPVQPTPINAYTSVDGSQLYLEFDMGVIGGISPGGFTFYENGNPISISGAGFPSSTLIQWGMATPITGGTTVTIDFDGTGLTADSSPFAPVAAFSNFPVTNNVPANCGYPFTELSGLTMTNADMTATRSLSSGTSTSYARPASFPASPYLFEITSYRHAFELSFDAHPFPTAGYVESRIHIYDNTGLDVGSVGVRASSSGTYYLITSMNTYGGTSDDIGPVLPQRVGVVFRSSGRYLDIFVDNILVRTTNYVSMASDAVLEMEVVESSIDVADVGREHIFTFIPYAPDMWQTAYDASTYDKCGEAVPTPAVNPLTDTGTTTTTLGFSNAPASSTPAPAYQTTTYTTTGSATGEFGVSIYDYSFSPTYPTLAPVKMYAIGVDVSALPTPGVGESVSVGLCVGQPTIGSPSKAWFLAPTRADTGDLYLAFRGVNPIFDNAFSLDGTQTVTDATASKFGILINTYTGDVDYYVDGQRQFSSVTTATTGSSNYYFALAFYDATGGLLGTVPVGGNYTAKLVTEADELELYGFPPSALDISGKKILSRATEWNEYNKGANIVLSNNNLTATNPASTWESVKSTFGKSTGSWYWETTIGASGAIDVIVGLGNATAVTSNYVGADANSWGYRSTDGAYYTNGGSSAYGATFTTGDKIGIAFNADTGDVEMFKNGASQGVMVTLGAGTYYPMMAVYNSDATVNFGADNANYAITYPVDYYNSGFYGA